MYIIAAASKSFQQDIRNHKVTGNTLVNGGSIELICIVPFWGSYSEPKGNSIRDPFLYCGWMVIVFCIAVWRVLQCILV